MIGKVQRRSHINPIPYAIGQRIRARRMEVGLTQAALAEMVGMSKNGLAHVEQSNAGRYPSGHTLAILSRALGVTMQFLWYGQECECASRQ